tara:strand:+ start:249 stop:389 length:141 start_codon:yes stop_codon:yes gene_type:complete
MKSESLVSRIYEIVDGDHDKASQVLDLILAERIEAIKTYRTEMKKL